MVPLYLLVGVLVSSPGHPIGEGRMRYLDNGHIKLGVDLGKGGSITYLAKDGAENMVNSSDLGRQIQMSFYSGPVPYTPNGKAPAKAWEGLGWNPIQTGDYYGHPSRVLDFKANKDSIYVKCIPMHWPLDNVPGECTFEEWIRLAGNRAVVRDRLTMNRPDQTQYPARGQELPAIYTNGPWYRLMSYTGSSPFTGAPLSEMTNPPPQSTFPWVGFHATENWAALVDKDSNGIGIVEPGIEQFSGGFFGPPGSGGAKDSPTGYIAPNAVEILDWNAVYDYRYELVVGSLKEIRSRAYAIVPKPAPPVYRFKSDRQHWSYVNCEDTGWPIRGEVNVKLENNDPQMIGPLGFWQAEDAWFLVIDAVFATRGRDAQIFWSCADAPGFSEQRRVTFKTEPDGGFRRYRIDLGASTEYRGIITQLRLDPEPSGGLGDHVRVRSISFERG